MQQTTYKLTVCAHEVFYVCMLCGRNVYRFSNRWKITVIFFLLASNFSCRFHIYFIINTVYLKQRSKTNFCDRIQNEDKHRTMIQYSLKCKMVLGLQISFLHFRQFDEQKRKEPTAFFLHFLFVIVISNGLFSYI